MSAANPLHQLETFLETYLVKKAPFQLPTGLKEFIVKFGPWITLVLIILFLPTLFALLGLSYSFMSMMGPFGMTGYRAGWNLYIILALVVAGLELIALPGLFKRSKTGWNFLFYAHLVSLVEGIVATSLGSILGTVIGLYFLFQIKEYYK